MGHVTIVKLLLENWRAIYPEGVNLEEPLVAGVRGRQEQTLGFLMECANKYRHPVAADRVLESAVREENVAVLESLRSHPNLRCTDSELAKQLTFAADKGLVLTVKALLAFLLNGSRDAVQQELLHRAVISAEKKWPNSFWTVARMSTRGMTTAIRPFHMPHALPSQHW
jgi:hypothetical protein